MDFSVWLESNLNDLYKSTVEFAPKTRFRQHAIDPIRIVDLSIVPFKGLNTIFFKGLAQNEGREYNPIILFKSVDFNHQPGTIQVKADDGLVYSLTRLSLANEVAIRCNCKDFRYRFAYYDHLDHSLYGKNFKKYESLGVGPPVNPGEYPGMCKHLVKLAHALRDSGILAD